MCSWQKEWSKLLERKFCTQMRSQRVRQQKETQSITCTHSYTIKQAHVYSTQNTRLDEKQNKNLNINQWPELKLQRRGYQFYHVCVNFCQLMIVELGMKSRQGVLWNIQIVWEFLWSMVWDRFEVVNNSSKEVQLGWRGYWPYIYVNTYIYIYVMLIWSKLQEMTSRRRGKTWHISPWIVVVIFWDVQWWSWQIQSSTFFHFNWWHLRNPRIRC